MPPRSRLREAGRSVLAHVPGRWRARLLGLAARGTRMPGAEVGLVSVVVVHEDGDRVDEALASVRAQTHPLLEVLVCPVGSARAVLPDDPRFRGRAPVATSYAAVNAGIEAATGRYVVLLRGCDRLLPHAVADLAGRLARSGADLVSGVLEQTGEAEPWLRRAQAEEDLVADLGLGNKAFTRDLARSLRLTAMDDWLCSPTLAHLLPTVRAEGVDRPVARFAHDRGRRAYGARPSPLPDLDHWLSLRDLVAGALAGSPFADGWTRHWYDVLAPRFVSDAERADDATWARLAELSAVPEGLDLRASSRSLLALAHDGRRDDVEALAAELDLLGDDVPTEQGESGPLAVWSSVSLPPEVRRLGERETRLRTHIVRVADTASGRRVDLWVHLDGVDQATTPLAIEVEADGTRLDVERSVDHAAERWAGARFQSAAPGAVRVEAPTATTRLSVAVTAGPVRRTATVDLPAQRPADTSTTPSVVDVGLEGDLLVVRLDRPAAGVRLRGPGTDVAGRTRPDGAVEFDTDRDLYGRHVRLATAVYRLEPVGELRADPAWRERLPVEVVGDVHRLRVLPDGDGPGALHLGPPRADDELGAYGQERLRASYAVDERPTDPDLWYFESFAGRSATDTPRAVHDEVHARSPERTLAWGVLDHGHWTPRGARPVVIGSREWYDVLGTARVLVTNTELEEWYRRRPDQLVVQCFHGYPSKAMGESQWLARELPPRRLAVMRRRSVETWDLISTPTPEMTEVYREQYGYAGPAAEQGYPRNDALTAPDADRVREAARRRLGVRADQTAVLYAPTWRDHLATRPRAAALSDHLDVDGAAAALGDSHVILLRGHRFHAATGSRPGVVDVTDHPEVNDLVLASDVAVLDYSSLRFDYALTGKPMVFLVPDLEEYTSGVRGFLFPFTDSAPGPLARTTGEVVTQLRDVGRLATSSAGRIADFNARYNPWQDGLATSRFVDLLEQRLGSADAGAGPEVR